MTMKGLQVIQYLNTRAFNARTKSHVFLRSIARLQAIYYHTLVIASKMHKKPSKKIIVAVTPHLQIMQKN